MCNYTLYIDQKLGKDDLDIYHTNKNQIKGVASIFIWQNELKNKIQI
jgi:hypothetical protein